MDLNTYLLDIFNINKCEILSNIQNNSNLTINRITEDIYNKINNVRTSEEINIKNNNSSNRIIQIVEVNNIQSGNNKLDNLSKIEYVINKLNNSNYKIENIDKKLGDDNMEFENILIESNIKDQNIELYTNKLKDNKKINDIKQLENKTRDIQIALDEVGNLKKLEILSDNEDPIKLSILPIYVTSSIYYSLYKLLQQFNKYKLYQIYIYLLYKKIFNLDIYKLLQSYIISDYQYIYILLNIYNKLYMKISKWIYSIYYLLLNLPIIVSNPSSNSISGIKIWMLSLFITFFIFITKYIFINNKKTIKTCPWECTEKKLRNLRNILEKNFLQNEQKLIYGKDSYSVCEYINNENLLENSNIGDTNLEDIIIRLNECTQIFIHLANGISHRTQTLNLNI
ncbi:uncharacterized protein CMU_020950 [Cryptosporidium muris RN66]|uniref:Uncharacterized protein n=1 Tax=Cryptosporidium muris (strain RN66) TaxID=441375 RepID=B6AJE1_CRYMR|nr:uncharacterized protein CMU_020950 [Cryptosporidium muris RN66]EEA08332.1 hypothetical protein, conserved [Cryptosporidium muris RN66]|eukprot:XP_002142681.1 hypothetical protein [Cryptosporidium muris RN66]